jgi:hypothetical protein
MRVRPPLMVGMLFSIPVANMKDGAGIAGLPVRSRASRGKAWP